MLGGDTMCNGKVRAIKGVLLIMLLFALTTGCEKSKDNTEEPGTQVQIDVDWTEDDKQTLRYVFNKDFGGEVGVCLPSAAFVNTTRMDIVETHFNNVTMENEMKPESLLGKEPNIGEDGYPILNFTVADDMLRNIKEYNDTCTKEEKKIRVRGHVLVWHSQTPEWFFHEDYDESKEYVDSDTMLARMENYIKQVLNHYHGEDSEFEGMIYAWDVVNEAINDTDGKLRADSSWFRVFYDDEFIIQAFVFANKYAPQNVKLFYNDYNDTNEKKCKGICELIKTIKENPDARIDGMGMQGHYDMNIKPSEFEKAIRKYAEVVDEIQITELDMKSSSDYTGSDVNAEYQKQAYKYKSLYDVVVRLVKEEQIPITAIIFWGTDDGNSWLQDSNSVGGSADGSRPQCPLLFDAAYQPKPAFWAFADPSKLEPFVQEEVALRTDDYALAKTVECELDDLKMNFTPIWDEGAVKVKVFVNDKSKDINDAVTVFADMKDSRSDGADIISYTVKRSDTDSKANGYEAEFVFESETVQLFSTIGFDIRVNDNGEIRSWNDTENTQDSSSKFYGKLTLKPYAIIPKGTIIVDGTMDPVWENVEPMELRMTTAESAEPEATAKGRALWDEDALYVLMEVKDPNLDVTGGEVHTQDSVEIFIDELNNKLSSYDGDDKQYRVNFVNKQAYYGVTCVADLITSETIQTENGYIVEMAIEWTRLQPEAGKIIGFEMQINDCKNGGRLGMVNWYDNTNTCWSMSASFGTVALVDVAK